MKSCSLRSAWMVRLFKSSTWHGGSRSPRGWSRPSPARSTSSTPTTPPLNGAVCPSTWAPCRRTNGAAPCSTASIVATRQAWTPPARPWGSPRTSKSSTPARPSSVISASPASPPRPTASGAATCPSTTPPNGSFSKNTASRMWSPRWRLKSGCPLSPSRIGCKSNGKRTSSSTPGAWPWTWSWSPGPSLWGTPCARPSWRRPCSSPACLTPTAWPSSPPGSRRRLVRSWPI